MADCCELGNKVSSFIKRGGFLEWLRNYHVLKKVSAIYTLTDEWYLNWFTYFNWHKSHDDYIEMKRVQTWCKSILWAGWHVTWRLVVRPSATALQQPSLEIELLTEGGKARFHHHAALTALLVCISAPTIDSATWIRETSAVPAAILKIEAKYRTVLQKGCTTCSSNIGLVVDHALFAYPNITIQSDVLISS